MRRVFWLTILSVMPCVVGWANDPGDETEPLHVRIDRLVSGKFETAPAQLATDAELVRRVYLDLAGRVPALEETRSFLADESSDKRTVLIDRLLASPDHVRRMTQVFHVMLMERLGDQPEWQTFLRDSFATNRPWDVVVQHILSPQIDNETTRGAAFWYTKRLEKYGQNPVDIPGLVRDLGRHFLGIDVQCAQCHDHLFVDDYKQEFYHGLLAFVGHTEIRTDVKFPAVAVKPLEKKAEYLSVFVQQPQVIGPKLPGGKELAIPSLAKNELFLQTPDKKANFPGIPRFDTLKLLGQELPRADNTLFCRNIANRLWWLIMGRGLVEPLDLHHSGNPPSHPELLEILEKEFANHAFDMRWLLRELVLSETYQRASLPTADTSSNPKPAPYLLAIEKPLSSEQMLASLRQVVSSGRPLVIPPNHKQWNQWQTLFDKALANPAREPEVGHNPTVKAALFLMHEPTILNWLQPDGENLCARLLRLTDSHLLANELYLAVLSRPATEEEQLAIADYLAKQDQARQGQERQGQERESKVVNLIWSLIASNEFSANH